MRNINDINIGKTILFMLIGSFMCGMGIGILFTVLIIYLFN